eukprot:1805846-Pyramimonas_sp.AAC.3
MPRRGQQDGGICLGYAAVDAQNVPRSRALRVDAGAPSRANVAGGVRRVEAAICKPLLGHTTTGEFNSHPNYSRTPHVLSPY